MLTKLYPTRSHTGAAQGGICAALGNVEEDHWEWHIFDTVKGGDYLVDQDAAEVMRQEAIDAVLDLEQMGLPFNRTPEGRIDQRRFGGHTRNHGEAAVRRACFAADRTGHMILQTLYQQCVKHEIDFFNEFYVLDMLLTEATASARQRRRRLRARHRRAARLPRQGASCSPPAASARSSRSRPTPTPSPVTAWASSTARASRWRTWSSTSSTRPASTRSASCSPRVPAARAASCATRTASASWSATPPPSRTSRRATWSPAPSTPRSARAAAAAGQDYVYLDLTHLPPEQLDAKLPDITEFARTYLGIEPYTDPIPIQPTAHYAMGGVPTNIDAQVLRNNTDVVPGLFAAGEVACVSVHGANRLGTNSLLDIIVFGRRGGLSAAAYANSSDFVDLPPNPEADTIALLPRLRDGGGTEQVAAIREDLQETMDTNASVYRTEATLKQAEVDIAALKQRYLRVGVTDRGKRYNTELLEAVELGFLLDLAEALVVSAKARNESRGGHFREDYPTRDDVNFMRHTMAYKVRSRGWSLSDVRLDYKPVVQTRYEPMERKY